MSVSSYKSSFIKRVYVIFDSLLYFRLLLAIRDTMNEKITAKISQKELEMTTVTFYRKIKELS